MSVSQPLAANETVSGETLLQLPELDRDTRLSVRILIVDDDHTLRESCSTFLGSDGYLVETCGRGREAAQLLARRQFDIVLLDLYMSGVPGMDLLKTCLEQHPDTIVIVMTGNPSVASSVESLRAGAWDYLAKPFNASQLQILVGRAAHTVLVTRETRELDAATAHEFGHSDKVTMLGMAPAFKAAIDLARRVASTDASVFLTGESGTGKELIAEFIHHHSRRSSRSMVAINCAALPEALLESEMFGHRKGAFTGATRDKPGLLETANGGTMLLDEVTEMPTPIQAKLLRVIQDGVVRRVGSETVDAVVNVRFIASTNRDPQELVDGSVLRQDLLYRLRVVPILVPPLRERVDDVPLLTDHFLRYYWSRHRGTSSDIPTVSSGARQALCEYQWTGNVRELQNLVERVVVLAEPGAVIQPHDLPFDDGDWQAAQDRPIPVVDRAGDEPYHSARERVLADFERRYLSALVNRAAGNMSKAARLAGVDRTTLYRLMEKHGLQRSQMLIGSPSR